MSDAAQQSAPVAPVWTDDRITDLTAWMLIRASLVFAPRLAHALAPTGLTPTQFGVLVQLENSPGIAQAALARRCLMTPQSMGEVLPALVDSGLVVRGTRSGRGHPIPVHITDAGRDLLLAATPAVEAANTSEALGLDPEERETLNRLLQKLALAED
ncbi:MarR family winged helix-turn-helix transcriptional regulator [Actinomycetospora termitidis]|uniref:MarR family winged helix-turn-helix transcriptional regulator n=1 Tax=Actinomycetospora termitidis TaxID=3053470 RepID=A0ABT7MD67_9PSEU|nr:MarR family winged helix-turn-helix transcriptional regulator [Actinomycetospora sp. Odt1-22]MDL5158605.1 MarR family winged helix-turn-helix transcriptional regulator [Actinomycetospora sp. Odt1-22]